MLGPRGSCQHLGCLLWAFCRIRYVDNVFMLGLPRRVSGGAMDVGAEIPVETKSGDWAPRGRNISSIGCQGLKR